METKPDRVVIADFEAGVSTMVSADEKQVDLAVLVVEPYMKSIETLRRLLEIVGANGIPRHLLVANKIRDPEDLELIRSALSGAEPDVVVPADDEIVEADLAAQAPLDRNPDSPAVRAIQSLAARIGV